MAGRKPSPASLDVLHGNPSKKGKDNFRNSIKAEIALPDPIEPRWGTAIEKKLFKKYWKELSQQLYTMRLLSELDIIAFEMLVTAYTKWQIAESKSNFATMGIHKIAATYQTQLHKLLQEFGLTPCSRTKIKLPHEQKNELEKYLLAAPIAAKKRSKKK